MHVYDLVHMLLSFWQTFGFVDCAMVVKISDYILLKIDKIQVVRNKLGVCVCVLYVFVRHPILKIKIT